MKKAISLVLVLCFMGTSVFAAPVAAAISPANPIEVQSAPLFTDILPTPLTDTEAATVEGEGAVTSEALGKVLGYVGCAVGGYVGGKFLGSASSNNTTLKVVTSVAIGSIVGGFAGKAVGTFVGKAIGMALPLP